METRANHLVIGLFVLLVAGAAFGFVYWMKNFGESGSTRVYYILFDGSVGGLSQASEVLFNGIRIGRVRRLNIHREDTRKVRVEVGVRGDTPIRMNSRAQIEHRGFTGQAVVQITAGSLDSPLLAKASGDEIPTIKSDPAASASLLEAAPEALSNANALFVRLNNLIANNEDSIRNTVQNVESFSSTLAANRKDISEIIKNAKDLSERFNRISDKFETAVDSVTAFATTDGESFLQQAKNAAASMRRLALKLEEAVGDSADGVVKLAKRSLQEFELFMRDGRRAAQNLDRVLERIDQNPRSFLFGGSNVPEYNPKQ
ncbi:MAG: MlaD family protein [Methyloligellaceae bacterium]